MDISPFSCTIAVKTLTSVWVLINPDFVDWFPATIFNCTFLSSENNFGICSSSKC